MGALGTPGKASFIKRVFNTVVFRLYEGPESYFFMLIQDFPGRTPLSLVPGISCHGRSIMRARLVRKLPPRRVWFGSPALLILVGH